MPWFEDIEVGTRTELGTYTFTEEEIVAFARKYDPQVFHTDPEAAKAGPFGGLVASGWHTTATWMKMMIRARTGREEPADADGRKPPAGGPSPGFLDLKWPTPVRPGDRISYSSTVSEKLDMRSRPDWGIVRSHNVGVNQNGETVLTFTGQGLVQRRNPAK
ncbi:MaoC domain protein dehydratase [Parvibaculum lavamentivorans DS-1]|uniref:MaoC domain protein dehydratase n=1 Tax=Parvibaculum lavamentivorans (strain DS-1 / DSM 13023 / NCIMB 13966) TaxID=402881 RepID=A7HVD4_PARL1|nr:MaoC family dehydratase [Parvibaculum lavamentivorans]ABS63867.1 MaoC domain protein dehydratase [Parvibaculum lavamentivorans DS-1]